MFRVLVNLGLRAFCARANLPYNMYEIVARQGLAAFNRERSFSWRVSRLDGMGWWFALGEEMAGGVLGGVGEGEELVVFLASVRHLQH